MSHRAMLKSRKTTTPNDLDDVRVWPGRRLPGHFLWIGTGSSALEGMSNMPAAPSRTPTADTSKRRDGNAHRASPLRKVRLLCRQPRQTGSRWSARWSLSHVCRCCPWYRAGSSKPSCTRPPSGRYRAKPTVPRRWLRRPHATGSVLGASGPLPPRPMTFQDP